MSDLLHGPIADAYARRCEILLDHLRSKNQPMTARQLADEMGWSIHEVSAKLKVLRRRYTGVIYDGETWVALEQDHS